MTCLLDTVQAVLLEAALNIKVIESWGVSGIYNVFLKHSSNDLKCIIIYIIIIWDHVGAVTRTAFCLLI